MAKRSDFTRRSGLQGTKTVPSNRHLNSKSVLDLKALNMVLPDEVLGDGDSPYLKNFRYYEETEQDERVAMSSRKGASKYSETPEEIIRRQYTDTTGQSDQDVTTTTWVAKKFDHLATGRLSKIEMLLKDDDGYAPMIVEIYDDSAGEPGDLLATSSVSKTSLSTEYAYVEVLFKDAPLITAYEDYWVVAYIQDDGQGAYAWSANTALSDGLVSSDSGATWVASDSFNMKTYSSPDKEVLGYFREYDNVGNRSLFAADGIVYKVDDADGSVSQLITGMDTSATYYDFARVIGKLYVSNGIDEVQEVEEQTVTPRSGIKKGKFLLNYKNRLFSIIGNRMWFSDLLDPLTFASTSFIDVPYTDADTGDEVTAYIEFQDTLVVFTRRSKFILYGSDPATYSLQQSIGDKGCVAPTAVAKDERYVYFMSDDGIYRFDGTNDERISDSVQPVVSDIADKTETGMVYADRKLHVYVRRTGDDSHNTSLVWDATYDQWFLDEGKGAKDGFVFDAEGETLIEVSSVIARLYYAETQFSDLGSPISYEYRTKYNDFGNAVLEKDLRRFYPLIRVAQPFNLSVWIDKDFENYPTENVLDLSEGQAIWGSETWGDFIWGDTAFQKYRIQGNVEGTFFQARFIRTGVNNPVQIVGYHWYWKTRNRVR